MKINNEISQLLLKHIELVKYQFPELLIQVSQSEDEFFITTNSISISNSDQYEDLIYSFIEEYHSKSWYNIFWGVDVSIKSDDIELLSPTLKYNNFFKIRNSHITTIAAEITNNGYYEVDWHEFKTAEIIFTVTPSTQVYFDPNLKITSPYNKTDWQLLDFDRDKFATFINNSIGSQQSKAA